MLIIEHSRAPHNLCLFPSSFTVSKRKIDTAGRDTSVITEPESGPRLRLNDHGSQHCDNHAVKSTSPLHKNGYENCIYSTNNIYMSDEDNNHDTNYINKFHDANHDARKLHE